MKMYRMKAKHGKILILLSVSFRGFFHNALIISNVSNKLLRITFDLELKVEEHTGKICSI